MVFWCRKCRQNSDRVTTNGGARCRWGRLNAGAVAENRRLSMRSVASLARSQVYHTERPPHVCNTFAMMQRVALVCQRQLILVIRRPTCNAVPSTLKPLAVWPVTAVVVTSLFQSSKPNSDFFIKNQNESIPNRFCGFWRQTERRKSIPQTPSTPSTNKQITIYLCACRLYQVWVWILKVSIMQRLVTLGQDTESNVDKGCMQKARNSWTPWLMYTKHKYRVANKNRTNFDQ